MRVGFSLVCALPLVVALSSEASADNILVFQRTTNDPNGSDTAGAGIAAALTAAGHTPTLMSGAAVTVPSDLSAYDSVWIGQLATLGTTEQFNIRNYAELGGGVLLSGERPCCEPMNAALQQLLSAALRAPPVVGQQGDLGDVFTPAATAVGGITNSPNVLASVLFGAAGGLGNVPAKNVWLRNPSNLVGGAVFPGEELKKGNGCYVVLMDLTLWADGIHPAQDRAKLAANMAGFLSDCGDTDGDGVSDEQEIASGTLPNDPDTDNDGLCDGGGTVIGVCVGGESVYVDSDNDSIIDPLDDDDDNDGVPTSFELLMEQMFPNVDGDGIPTWLDLDSDDDLVFDKFEGTGDYNMNGIPAIVESSDWPQQCSGDDDCGATDSGMVCDMVIHYCQEGCRGTGNGCPAGETCTSTDNTIGECLPDGQGGGGPGATSSSTAAGGPAGAGGAGATASVGSGAGGGDGDGAADDDAGCNCRTPRGSSEGNAGLSLGLLAGALLLLRSRRRR